MSIQVVKRDISYQKLQEINKNIASSYATYGVHRDKGIQMRGKINEATIASQIEFGTGIIQPRPAIRTFNVSAKAKQALMDKEAQSMAKALRRRTDKGFWEEVAGFVQEYIKNRILSGLYPPNKPSTIAKKGFDLPWVETGRLVYEDMEARVHK